MYEVFHLRRQFAVGQGSFHAASVTTELPTGAYRFDYVYDCGALENARRSAALDFALESYEPRGETRTVAGKPETVTVIDALVLSHFDRDHMNGAEQLALKHSVERIYVPYLSPRELALEIARQAETLDGKRLQELFSVANGGPLWGAPITRVEGGPPGDSPQRDIDNGRFPPADARPTQAARDRVFPAGRFPRAMRSIVDGGGSPVGASLKHGDDVRVECENVANWQLRFWNYEISDELAYYVAAMLDAVGFPVDALELPNGASTVASWLALKANRDAAVEAYIEALRLYAAPWSMAADTRHIPNLISLSLFSGPWYWDSSTQWGLFYDQSPLDRQGWRPYNDGLAENHRVGWLGTGDAMLGEADIWTHFESHYKYELPRVRTVLLPHHGAAPANGPSFYNPRLNALPGTMSVISVGSRNPYGHPKDEVIFSVRKNEGILKVVTEKWDRGFGEFVWGKVFPTP